MTNQDLRGTLLSPKLTLVTKKIAEGNIKNYLQKYNYHKIRNGKAKRRDSEKNYWVYWKCSQGKSWIEHLKAAKEAAKIEEYVIYMEDYIKHVGNIHNKLVEL